LTGALAAQASGSGRDHPTHPRHRGDRCSTPEISPLVARRQRPGGAPFRADRRRPDGHRHPGLWQPPFWDPAPTSWPGRGRTPALTDLVEDRQPAQKSPGNSPPGPCASYAVQEHSTACRGEFHPPDGGKDRVLGHNFRFLGQFMGSVSGCDLWCASRCCDRGALIAVLSRAAYGHDPHLSRILHMLQVQAASCGNRRISRISRPASPAVSLSSTTNLHGSSRRSESWRSR